MRENDQALFRNLSYCYLLQKREKLILNIFDTQTFYIIV